MKKICILLSILLVISACAIPVSAETNISIPTPVVKNVSVNYKTIYTSYPYEYYNVPYLYVTWDAVSNAEKYIVEVWRYNEEQDTYSQCCYKYNISGTSCEIGNEYTSNDFKPNEELYVSVTAYSETHSSQSEASEKYAITMPNIVLDEIEFDNYSLSLKAGDTQYITPTLSPYNATNRDVKWSSSNTNVATISSGGKITAVSEGRTIITCYGLYGDAFAVCEVIVTSNENAGEPNTEVSTGSGNCGDNATWVLDENGVLTISGTGAIWNSNNYTGWKNLRKYVKEVKIEEGITEIGEYSFIWCSNLLSIELPDSLTGIKYASFEGCGLSEITIPKNVANIGDNVFLLCTNLTSINVANGNSTYFSIDGVLFDTTTLTLISYPTNKQTTHYSVPNGIEHIGKSAVRSDNLRSITLPDSLKTIGDIGIAYCRNLSECNIPNSVSSIGTSAFSSTGLTTLILPTSLETLSSHAFYDCNKLDYVVIPKSLTCIGDSAFRYCDNITHINYGGSQEEWNAITIGLNNEAITDAFVNFNSTHVHSGGAATCSTRAVCEDCGKEYGAFAHSLVFFDYKQSTCKEVGWKSYEKCLNCSYTTYEEIPLVSHKLDKYGAFPASCETEGNTTYYKCSVCEQFFSDSNGENKIYLSDTVISPIGHSYSNSTGLCTNCDKVKPGYCGANITWTLDENGLLTISGTGEMWENFSWEPTKIKEVVINTGVTNISAGAFKGCINLQNISIPNSVVSIGAKAFYGTSLKQIVIPNSVEEIEKNALYGCNNLEELTVPFVGGSQTSNTILGYIFSSTTSSYTDSSSGAIIYKTTYHIPTTLKKVTITKETSLSSSAFKNCGNIEEIVLPNTLTTIASTAFEECTKLTDVYFTGTNTQWESLFQGELDATVHFIEVPITSIVLNKTEITLQEGTTETLTATIAPTYATNNSIYWSSSNTTVATVLNGVITAITPGTTIITVSTTDGSVTATCTVTVNSVINGVFLDKTSTALVVGNTETLTAIVLPASATNKSVSWVSSNTSVATVSNGVITAIAPGTTTITITTLDGSNKTATCNVTVNCNHSYSTTLIQGETTHYYECNHCHDKKNEVTHEYKNYTSNDNNTHTGTCICGKINTDNCTGNDASATCQVKAICFTCGKAYGAIGGHSFDTSVWSYKGTDGHAHKCTVSGCDEHDTVVSHIPNVVTATEQTAKYCTVCEYVIEQQLNHVHSEGTSWESDSEYHWHDCVANDGQEYSKAKHTYDNACDTTCNVCNAPRTITHDYSKLEKNATEHWYVCSVCGSEKVNSRVTHNGGTATCQAKANCSTCGVSYGNIGNHSYNTDAWEYKDSNGHAHKCTANGCGEHDTVVAHTPNIPEVTEQQAQSCTNCGYEIAAQLSHTHNSATVWTYNDTHHWHACSGCNSHLDEAPHNYANDCDTNCDCGYVRTVTHDFTGDWQKDADGHWHVCADGCGTTDTKADHVSAGAATETDPEVCSICGWQIAPALGHTTHTPQTEWQKNDTHHWHECTGCNGQELEKAAHNDGDNNGSCDACGHTMNITPPPHTHSYGTTWEINANEHWNECTCGEKTNKEVHIDGDNNSKCDTCNYTMTVTTPEPQPPVNTPSTDDPNAGATDDLNGSNSDKNIEDDSGLSTGAIAGIAIGSAATVGIGGFSLIWFVIKKKSWADLLAIFKK